MVRLMVVRLLKIKDAAKVDVVTRYCDVGLLLERSRQISALQNENHEIQIKTVLPSMYGTNE